MNRWVLALAAVVCATGCQGPRALPREYADGLAIVTKKIADQGMLDRWVSEASANVDNPGLESYVRVETAVGVRIAGMNGELDLDAGGLGTQMPPGMREALIEQLGQPISDAQRDAILQILGWNRAQTEAGGGSTGGG